MVTKKRHIMVTYQPIFISSCYPVTTNITESLVKLTKVTKELETLKDKIKILEELVVYHYLPSTDEWDLYFEHSAQIDACGGCAPTSQEFFIDMLLSRRDMLLNKRDI